MHELRKPGQYRPMSVSRQVVQLYAGTNRDDAGKRGWLRDIPVIDIVRWAKEFMAFCEAKYPAILTRIDEKKELPVANKQPSDPELNKALTEFNAMFQKTPGAKV